MIYTILIVLACIIGTLVAVVVGFVWIAWLFIRDDELLHDQWERMHGLRDNE